MKTHIAVTDLKNITSKLAKALAENGSKEFKIPSKNKGESDLDFALRINKEATTFQASQEDENQVIYDAVFEDLNTFFKTYKPAKISKRAKVTDEMVEKMKGFFEKSMSASEIANILNISIPTVNNYKSQLGYTKAREETATA